MHLLVISQYFWPENFRINDLVADFVQKGHQVTVLTGLPNYPEGQVFDSYRRAPADFASYAGARVVRVPMLARGRGAVRLVLNYFSFALSASLWGAWRLRKERVDAILVYEPSPVTVGIPGAVLRWCKRVPMAFWVLDLWPETLKAVGIVSSDWGLWLVGLMVRWIYRRCDLILAQSQSFIPQIRRHTGDAAQIAYFPSWAESLFAGNADQSRAEELAGALGSFTVLFAGNIGEAQDFPSILAAAEYLKDTHPHIRWVVLGDGRVKPWVEHAIVERNLASCVHLLGRFPVERMPSFFQGADALLVSLKKEPIFAMTIPGKLQSYLAAGRPIVAMLDGEGADLLDTHGAGVTCPAGDAVGLADAVLLLSTLTDVARAEMGRKGLALYEQEFERSMLLGRLEAWLLQMAASAPKEARPHP
ncbi:glycosyltransferase family 4 protein [Rhodoferax sp.]|uniref:glycosyltransferase family 4 protein n=1 Tax=Rhodoferax sp. TaxID=50421 RepID=UPI002ACD63CD|nr:glycosyltransferase family 4 protein [Rhodoferax sp.]MDZ7922009.1 glycosyltransferase family 4 protein [Rhodoferax sp.]